MRGGGGQRGGGGGGGGQRGGGGGAGGGQRGGGQQQSPILRLFDTDKDGELSTEEIAKASAVLMALDKDGDKKLTATELRPEGASGGRGAVSYTHLTLPTICRV